MTPSPASLPPRPEAMTIVRVVRTAVRLALVLGMLLAGLALMETWHLMFHESRAIPIRLAEDGGSAVAGLPDRMFADGTWQFGGNEWSFATSDVAPDATEPALEASIWPPTGSRSELETIVLDWLRSVRATVAPIGSSGLREHRHDWNGSRVRVLTRVEGATESVLRVRLDRPTADDRASRLEIVRSSAVGRESKSMIAFPEGARVLASRTDAAGVVQAQLVGPTGGWSDIQKWAERDGWQIETPYRSPEAILGFRLRRDADAIDLWRYSGTEAASRDYLLLVRGN